MSRFSLIAAGCALLVIGISTDRAGAIFLGWLFFTVGLFMLWPRKKSND